MKTTELSTVIKIMVQLKSPPCVLSTKKLSASQAELFRKANINLISTNFIITKPLFPKEIPRSNYVIITSQNALHILKNLPQSQKIMCVGEKTRQRIEAQGFTVVESKPYAKELAQLIMHSYAQSTFVLLVGNVRGEALPVLKTQGVQLQEITVYENHSCSKKITQEFNAVLFFSPSAVRSFLQSNSLVGKKAYCIGTTTQAALEGLPSEKAYTPTVEATIEMCIKHLNK